MKNLIKFLSIIFLAGAVLASGYFVWNNRQHYGDWGQGKDISEILKKYTISVLENPEKLKISPPVLPDITPYTIEAIEAKIPEISQGTILIQNLEEGYRKMRSRLAFFGEKQDRLDPLSIIVNAGVYDLEKIYQEVADKTLIQKRDDGVYVLYVPLSIRAEATLVINEGDVLLMSVNTGAMLSTFGDVFIYKATVKGWDTNFDKPALYQDPEMFRPHITAWCGSNLYIADSHIAYLGYQDSKSYGVTYTACTDTLYRDDYGDLPGATGWIVNNKFNDIYFGFYSYESNNIVIIGNIYEDNIVYAIDPHDRSENLIIAYNQARRAKQKHGIIVSREVSKSFIFKNIIEDNPGSGIMIDRNSQDNVIAYNVSRNNGQDGLTFYESPNNISYRNQLIGNKNSGMRIRNSWNITSQEDIINDNEVAAIQLYSLSLKSSQGASYRNLDLDPYAQKAGANIINPEIIGNKQVNFKVEKFNELNIVAPKFYKSPYYIFAGDLKGIDTHVKDTLYDNSLGVRILNTGQSNQNFIRSSVDPR